MCWAQTSSLDIQRPTTEDADWEMRSEFTGHTFLIPLPWRGGSPAHGQATWTHHRYPRGKQPGNPTCTMLTHVLASPLVWCAAIRLPRQAQACPRGCPAG